MSEPEQIPLISAKEIEHSAVPAPPLDGYIVLAKPLVHDRWRVMTGVKDTLEAAQKEASKLSEWWGQRVIFRVQFDGMAIQKQPSHAPLEQAPDTTRKA